MLLFWSRHPGNRTDFTLNIPLHLLILIYAKTIPFMHNPCFSETAQRICFLCFKLMILSQTIKIYSMKLPTLIQQDGIIDNNDQGYSKVIRVPQNYFT